MVHFSIYTLSFILFFNACGPNPAALDFKKHVAEIKLSALAHSATGMMEGLYAATLSFEAGQSELPARYSQELKRIHDAAFYIEHRKGGPNDKDAQWVRLELACDAVLSR